MADSDSKKTLAVSKSLKISKAQQYMLLEVLITSLLLGVAIVLSIWLVKYIAFNNKVVTEYGDTIKAYETTIINVGVCDPGSDGKLSDAELKSCNPNDVDVESMPNSLRYNILVNVANNVNLESVARNSQAVCYDGDKKIDFSKEYSEATSEKEKGQALAMMSMCSALRVVPDALPGQENPEATVASLNQLFLLSRMEPESLSVSELSTDEISTEETEGEGGGESDSLGTIPVAFDAKYAPSAIRNLLENIELSIRTFNVTRAVFEWSDGQLNMNANANAYYFNNLSSMRKVTKTVYGGDKETTTETESSTSETTMEEE